jgi:hypothetical protein
MQWVRFGGICTPWVCGQTMGRELLDNVTTWSGETFLPWLASRHAICEPQLILSNEVSISA